MEEEEEWFDEDEWLQTEAEGAPWAPHGASVIVVDVGRLSIWTKRDLDQNCIGNC